MIVAHTNVIAYLFLPGGFAARADSNCSAYDCEFVSVAMRLGVKLLTADKKVLMAFPAHTLQFSAT